MADASHEKYVDTILKTIEDAAKVRGTGIAKRTHEYLTTKMREAKAVIALCGDRFAGFSYIETWGNKQYVTTSGLIVHPDFRGMGIAKRIKDMTFSLARTRWPHAKIFSLTSGAAVMTMNTQLGYQPVKTMRHSGEVVKGASMWMCCTVLDVNTAFAQPCFTTRKSICPQRFRRMCLNESRRLMPPSTFPKWRNAHNLLINNRQNKETK